MTTSNQFLIYLKKLTKFERNSCKNAQMTLKTVNYSYEKTNNIFNQQLVEQIWEDV